MNTTTTSNCRCNECVKQTAPAGGEDCCEERDDGVKATDLIQCLALVPKYPRTTAHDAPTRRMKIDLLLSELKLSDETYGKVRDLMMTAFNRGLGRKDNATAAVKMFPSYVRSIPDGTERGKFLALDLGGTNFRVLLIELEPGSEVLMKSKIYAIPQRIMVGTGKGLFDHIAHCLAMFIREHKLENETLPLGFTFSFPCRQEGLTAARLVKWTKGFRCSGVEGEDVVRLLREAVARKRASEPAVCCQQEYDIDVVALVNDTVGTLMAVAHRNPKCLIGLIIGTGTNACYMEQLDNVELWNEDYNEPKEVIINTEWGAFGDDGDLDFMLTSFDHEVDKGTLNRGKQLYEKMISGMYMGEVARQVLVKLVEEKLLFSGELSEELSTRGNFYTKYISEIESDPPGDYTNVKQVLEELDITNYTDEDCQVIRETCEVVSSRASYLCAAGLAALLQKINRDEVSDALWTAPRINRPQLVDPVMKFHIQLSLDGSGIGAAIVAAVAVRMTNAKLAMLNDHV
ncbi:PREDICTED: hexokinase-2-like [Priapulus caudatus]|uniref:Phosphotransferase n=1 Tax=Priapulus caudatus TaxID=37621 RepID=A0ABM1DV39_PRICU|nr:PREDICTED: hexokinase-2-like [Priapulus caudatus]